MIQLKYYPPAGRGEGGGGGVTKKRFVWESSGLTLFFYILFLAPVNIAPYPCFTIQRQCYKLHKNFGN